MAKWRPWRLLPKPPVLVGVKWRTRGRYHGDSSAALTLNLDKGTVTFLGCRWRLRPSKLKALKAFFEDAQEATFTAQVFEDYISVVARRKARRGEVERDNILAISLDLNSRYGTTLLVMSFREGKATLHELVRVKPPNHAGRRKVAAALQSLATGLERSIPYDRRQRYYEEARRVRGREGDLNEEYVNKVVAKCRRWCEWGEKHSLTPVILIDLPRHSSLRRTPLQGTITRIRKKLENLARWYGGYCVVFGEDGEERKNNVSGKRCPLCNEKMEEVGKETRRRRLYRCGKCKIVADKDYNTCWRLILLYFKDEREAIRELIRELGPRALGAPVRPPGLASGPAP